jgi:hypothetical protein
MHSVHAHQIDQLQNTIREARRRTKMLDPRAQIQTDRVTLRCAFMQNRSEFASEVIVASAKEQLIGLAGR